MWTVWTLFSLAMIEGLSRLWSGVGVALPGDPPRLDLQYFIYRRLVVHRLRLKRPAQHAAQVLPPHRPAAGQQDLNGLQIAVDAARAAWSASPQRPAQAPLLPG